MHILYHHRTAGDGVEHVHILGMVRALRRLGHSVEISSPPGCDPENNKAEESGRSRGGPDEGLLRTKLKRVARAAPPVFFEFLEVAYNLYSAADMLIRFRRRKPDLIYERTASNSFMPTLLARHWGIPIVQEVNVTAEVGRFRPLVLPTLARLIERWISVRATLAVTVSDQFRRILIATGWPAESTLVCHNAIDSEEFNCLKFQLATRPQDVPKKGFTLGWVGSFLQYHGLDMLFMAARELSERYNHLRWLLVGDGVERPRIERLLTEFGLEEKFWMPGNVPHEEVPSYIMAMDAAVLPNSETYNSPMKLFEYMAMGKPVIAPRVPAIEEVVRHEETGLLFKPGDLHSFRHAIERVICDAELRKRLGRNARNYVLEHHTWTKNAERVLACLEQVQRTGKVSVE